MKWWLLLLLIVNQVVANEVEQGLHAGKEFANSLLGAAPTATVTTNLADIPGYQTANPSEAALYAQHQDGKLHGVVQAKLQQDEVAKAIYEDMQITSNFVIDPATDPLFKQAPEEEQPLATKEENITTEGTTTQYCEEGGAAINYECLDNRYITPQVPIKTATLLVNHLEFNKTTESYEVQTRQGGTFRHGRWETRHRQIGWSISLPQDIAAFKEQFCKGFVATDVKTGAPCNVDCNRIQGYRINNGVISQTADTITVVLPFKKERHFWGETIISVPKELNITLEHDTYEGEELDEWRGCEQLEQMVDAGLCQYGERTLTKGPATHNINGYSIFKDEWQYRQVYHCKVIRDECQKLRAQGCVQIGSQCKEWRQNNCWLYQQKYSCPNGKMVSNKLTAPNLGLFCLSGDCHDASYTANGEMLDAVAKLQVLKEVQHNRRANNYDFKVFKGDSYQCRRNCLNFKDCCGGMKGWGVSLKMTHCKPEEQQLATMRQQALCHQVGATYCAKKIGGKCAQKRTSFCCFGTKLAKIIQEQGRAQLGISWGDAKCPDCRALTIDELTKINLAKVNFSEVFIDLISKYKAPNIDQLKERVGNKIKEHITRIATETSDHKQPTSGVVYEHKEDGL